MPFDGFSPADFDAFEEKKWASNAFNLERLEVKLKLTALGKELQSILGQGLLDQEMGISADRPSVFNQHRVNDLTLYFFRGPKARKPLGAILDGAKSIAANLQDPAPHHKHIIRALRISQAGVDFGLWLHKDAWVDWKNALARAKAYGEMEKLQQALDQLPAELLFGRGLGLDADGRPARELDAAALLEGFEAAQPWTFFGRRLGRDEDEVGQGALAAKIADCLLALEPLHDYLAWTPENDHHQIKSALKEQKEKARKPIKELSAGDEVRVLSGLASGRIAVVDSIERRGMVKVRLGLVVLSMKMEDLARP